MELVESDDDLDFVQTEATKPAIASLEDEVVEDVPELTVPNNRELKNMDVFHPDFERVFTARTKAYFERKANELKQRFLSRRQDGPPFVSDTNREDEEDE